MPRMLSICPKCFFYRTQAHVITMLHDGISTLILDCVNSSSMAVVLETEIISTLKKSAMFIVEDLLVSLLHHYVHEW